MLMSTAYIQERVPVGYGVTLIAVLLVSLVYAVFTKQIGVWIWGVVAIVSLGLSFVGIYLFYRLVRAVERIAYDQ